MYTVSRTKIYFASDFHLGLPNPIASRAREILLVSWLDSIKDSAAELYLMGDIFDFWYEYRYVVPRGYTRFLGKLAELADSGIKIHIFAGNHDCWLADYLPSEFECTIYTKPLEKEYAGKKFYLHHGHALGKYDRGMNFLDGVFRSSFLRWCFSRIHPNGAFGFAHRWSQHNRKKKIYESSNYLGDDKEWLLLHSNDVLKTQYFDYFVYGHRHLPLDILLNNQKSRYVNLGTWLGKPTFAVFDGYELRLTEFVRNSL